MIVDASVVIDAVADPGPRGVAARAAFARIAAAESLHAPGHLTFEVLSGLRATANRPGHPFQGSEVGQALADAESLGIEIDPIPWLDMRRAWELSQQSVRYADAIYIAAAERSEVALLTADARLERSSAAIRCAIITVTPEPVIA